MCLLGVERKGSTPGVLASVKFQCGAEWPMVGCGVSRAWSPVCWLGWSSVCLSLVPLGPQKPNQMGKDFSFGQALKSDREDEFTQELVLGA